MFDNDSIKDLKFRLDFIEDKLTKAKDYLDIAYRLAFKLTRRDDFCGTEEHWKSVAEEVLAYVNDSKWLVDDALEYGFEEAL